MSESPPIPTQLALRLALYRQSFEDFAHDVLKIQTKEHGIQPFALRPYQHDLVVAMQAQEASKGWVRQIWLKSRQLGASTLAQGWIFHRTILHPNVNSIVVAHDIGIAETIFQMARRFYLNLPPEMRPTIRHSTKQGITFANPSDKRFTLSPGLDSRIIVATAKNIHAGAGGTFHHVHLSEAARYPNPEEIEASTLQSVGFVRGTTVIIESTARPEGQWFHKMCQEAWEGRSPYEFHFRGWHQDATCTLPLDPGEVIGPDTAYERNIVKSHAITPEQLKWRRTALSAMRGDEATFMREFPLTVEEAFTSRDAAVIPHAHLVVLREGVCAPKFTGSIGADARVFREADGPLRVWVEPQPGALYDIGADVALGHDNGDWSVGQVISRATGEQIAEYHGRISPGEFADILYWLGHWYNTAQIAVERNGIGEFTNERLVKTLGYPNMYLWRPRGRLSTIITGSTGWYSTHRLKQELLATTKDRIYRYVAAPPEGRTALVRSPMLMHELENFVYLPNGEVGATGQAHDDLVIAWMVAHQARYDELEGFEFAPLTSSVRTAVDAINTRDIVRFMTPEEARVGTTRRNWLGHDLEGW